MLIPCDLCETCKDHTDLYHFTGTDDKGYISKYFDPDFDQGIYCSDCINNLDRYYLNMGIPARFVVSLMYSKESEFRDL